MPEAVDAQQNEPVSLLASVLIVCYNRAAALKRCLSALEKSRERSRLDIIVLDTGSRDGSGQLDSDFPEVTFLRMPRNFGATKALNIGARTAKAGLLFLLDPSVEVRAETIPELAAVLAQTPDAGAVCPLLTDAAGKPLPQVRRLPDKEALGRAWRDPAALTASVPDLKEPLIANEYAGRKALLIPKTFLKGMNYFDEKYGEFGGDLELAFQVRHAARRTYIATAVAVTDHSATESAPAYSDKQLATLAADRLNGAAHYLGKRAGMSAGLLMRAGAVFGTLGRVLTLQKPGYTWPLLMALVNRAKIDGSQSGL